MRPIDSDDFLKQSTELYEHAGWDEREVHFSLADLRCNLEMMPTVEAEPVRHGHWSIDDSDWFETVYRCTVCKKSSRIRTPYCPNCGAKMDERKE